MLDASSPPSEVEALRADNARLRAELAAEREARRVLELRAWLNSNAAWACTAGTFRLG